MDIREHGMVVDQQLRLKWELSAIVKRDRINTYVEDAKNSVEVPSPTRNHIFIGLCMEDPRDRTSFTLFDDLSLDLGHSPAIDKASVSRPQSVHISASTYMVSSSIAPSTDGLRLSGRLPFKPRSRALHMPPQDSPMST